MGYVEKKDIYQLTISNFDALVDSESTARLIDAFVDSLELNKYDIKECMSGEYRSHVDAGASSKQIIPRTTTSHSRLSVWQSMSITRNIWRGSRLKIRIR